MDCEKFETAMMDELYGELDELTSAAAKRHISGCARCAALFSGLRATRRVATVALVDPPAGLEERILALAREAPTSIPLQKRIARLVSIAGSWAMRPQTAMAALFMVMLGTSLLLLRGRSSRAPASAEITVTERGTPAPAASAASPAPLEAVPALAAEPAVAASAVATAPRPADLPRTPTSPAPTTGAAGEAFAENTLQRATTPTRGMPKDEEGPVAARKAAPGAWADMPPSPAPAPALPAAPPAPRMASGGAMGNAYAGAAQDQTAVTPFDAAIRLYQSARYDEAARAFDALAPADPNADLWAARSIREGKGSRAAIARFDRVANRASGTPPGWDALLEGALCYRSTGDFGNARVRLNALLGVDSHKDRARAELERLNQLQPQGNAYAQPPAKAGARPPAATASAPASGLQ
jgi:hypothetical protein